MNIFKTVVSLDKSFICLIEEFLSLLSGFHFVSKIYSVNQKQVLWLGIKV